MAINPLKYEPLRDAQRLAADQEKERRDNAQREHVERSPGREGQDPDREKINQQARYEVELDKAKRYEWQKVTYEQQQREEARQKDLSERSLAYMKENDPKEYARQEKENGLRAERAEQEKQIKQAWREKQGEQSDKSREKGDSAQERDGNKWRSEMSDAARAKAQESQQRDAQERERDRSGR